jgi:CheY-like chemotaxis protein
MQQIYAITLSSMGFTSIIAAHNGAEALDILRTAPSRFDFIFCDLAMSPIDGFEFIHTVRHSDEVFDPEIPVIVVSGKPEADNLDRALRVGASEYLAKPISVQNLYQKIEAVLEQPLAFQKSSAILQR